MGAFVFDKKRHLLDWNPLTRLISPWALQQCPKWDLGLPTVEEVSVK